MPDLLDRAEDVYDDSVRRISTPCCASCGDALRRSSRCCEALDWVIADFRVHYVLNMFDGVEREHERGGRSVRAQPRRERVVGAST